MLAQITNKLDDFARAWSDWMWDISLHVTWLVVLLWLMDRLFRNTSARLRFVLWSLVLVRLVLPPGLSLPTGLGWWVGEPISNLVAGLVGEQAPDYSAYQPSLANARLGATNHTITGLNAQSWHVYLFALWLGFVTAQLVWIGYGWWQVRTWLAQAVCLSDDASQYTLHRARRRAGFTGQVSLYDSGSCVTPLVIGYWRPKILLPTILRETLSQSELETVLVHELTHLSRGDAWWKAAQAFLGTIYFFHPAVWLARYKLNQVCEEACDEQTVLALSGERRAYAQAIVKAATIIGYQPPYLAMNMLGDALPIKRRLQRILDPALPWRSAGGWRHAAIALVAALVLLPGVTRPSKATPPELARLSGLPSVREEVHSPDTDATQLQASGSSSPTSNEELAALEQLKSVELETRLSAYETLERVGSLQSLPELEAAFLKRSGIEQDAAKRALDRVWSIIRRQPSDAAHATQRSFIDNN